MWRAVLFLSLCSCATTEVGQAAPQEPADQAVAAAESDLDAQATKKKPACETSDHRAFDFWVGKWEVRNPEGKVVGQNYIQKIHGGCALREEWQGAGGSAGTSLNIYDASRKVWHQTWVDASGNLLVLEGGLDGERMVLRGETRKGDERLTHEIAWTPLPDGRVKQHWRSSKDGGQNWADVFVGLYGRTDG